MFAPPAPPSDPEYGIVAYRCGRIVVEAGRLLGVERRLLPHGPSIARVWIDSRIRASTPRDGCSLVYSGTRAVPGFLAVNYARSGEGTSLVSLHCALAVLDHIARLRQCVAIVAHISTWAISDRALQRFGWEPQSTRLAGRHWIRRFYDGYPEPDLSRYCRPMSPARISR